MKLIIAGLGPGNPELITIEALNKARSSDVILVPRAHKDIQGIAEGILLQHMPERKLTPVLFPMIHDGNERDNFILRQLKALKPIYEHSNTVFFPVIGDSLLYSTGAYLIQAFRKIIIDVDVEFVPGISAHSLASSCAKRFTAMSDQIFTIMPGTSDPERVKAALMSCNSAAIYKPKSLRAIKNIIIETGPYEKIIRVDFAGIPDKERILEGIEALEGIDEYLSIILLWK